MSASSGRRIHVCRTPSTDGVYMHITDGALEKENLISQFPCASGLKYLIQGQWVAVNVHNDRFIIPEDINEFVAVTEAVEKARSVLGNQSLARQVSSVFGRAFSNQETSTSGIHSTRVVPSSPTASAIGQNMSRKQTRNLFPKRPKLPKSKMFKVVFVRDTNLPTNFSKDLVFSEGLLSVNESEQEGDIMANIHSILTNSNIPCEADALNILSYSSKTLARPCLAASFRWSLETIKSIVGQGKLYVMVHLNDPEELISDETDLPDSGIMCPISPKASSLTASTSCMTSSRTVSASSTTSSLTTNACHTASSLTASVGSTTSSLTASVSSTISSLTASASSTTSSLTASASLMASTSTASTSSTASSLTASTSSTASSLTASASPTDEDDFIELGTPTVLLKRRRRHQLRLTRNRDTRVPQPTPETSADIRQKAGSSESDMEHSDDSKCFGPDPDASDTDMDEALQEAINESLRPKASFEESLRKWRDSTKQETSPVLLVINRQAILQSTRRALCRKGFQFTCPVKISFSGEDGEDYGGPRREFFSLLLKELADRLLENGCLRHSLTRLEDKEYEFMGKTVVWSLLHGGPSFPFLEHHTIAMLFNDTENIQLNLKHAPVEERAMIEKLQEAETISEETSDWLINLGLSPPFHVDNKKKIIDISLKQVLFYRIHAELSQLREGLRSFKFLDCMSEYKSELKTLLCNQPVVMTFEEAKKLMQVVYSEDGSNAKKEELNTIYAFDVFLQDCIDSTIEVTFADLLSFWTGASAVPPLGFDKKLEIHFVNGKDRLPVAHTCEMSLELPRGVTEEELQEKLMKAIQWGGEFHLF